MGLSRCMDNIRLDDLNSCGRASVPYVPTPPAPAHRSLARRGLRSASCATRDKILHDIYGTCFSTSSCVLNPSLEKDPCIFCLKRNTPSRLMQILLILMPCLVLRQRLQKGDRSRNETLHGPRRKAWCHSLARPSHSFAMLWEHSTGEQWIITDNTLLWEVCHKL